MWTVSEAIPSPSVETTHTVPPARRIVIIDALRGLALSLMALEHAAFYSRVNTLAEHHDGRTLTMWKWPFWVTGLITNMAPAAFWLVARVGVALFETAKRRRGEPERPITRHFVIRAAVLVALDVVVIGVL